MLDFLQPVVDFFNFIGTILGTIIDGFAGVISIITNIVNLILSITRILPSPLYPFFQIFMSVYLSVFIYKIFRNG